MTTELSKRLKEWRATKKLSQATAAWILGCPLDTLRAWEQSKREPRGMALKLLLEKLEELEK